jgi:hypothetical protein
MVRVIWDTPTNAGWWNTNSEMKKAETFLHPLFIG